MLGELAVGDPTRRTALIDSEAAYAGGAGIDCQYDGHGRDLIDFRRSHRSLESCARLPLRSVQGAGQRQEHSMRVAVLTGGGDCPGLNAVIRAAVRKAERDYGYEVIGFLDGWRGVVSDEWMRLDIDACRGLLPKGGTVLGTSRHTPFNLEGGVDRARDTVESLGVDALIAIGGEGTLTVARQMFDLGFNVVGVPKTIDNDVAATEHTFGFDTAFTVATDAIDRLRTTAESHDRVIVVEVMGRHVGHIATWSGIAGGATVTLVPEVPFDLDQVCETLARRHAQGRYASIVVVAEGALPKEGTLDLAEPELDAYGHKRLGGIGNVVAAEIEARTHLETRVTILGHVQRGGTPTPADRVLATRFGIAAMEAVHDGDFGAMVALQAGSIVRVSLAEATAALKPVSQELLGRRLDVLRLIVDVDRRRASRHLGGGRLGGGRVGRR